MLPNSPSLNVALREVGLTFLHCVMLSLPNSPSLNVALRYIGFTFWDFFVLSLPNSPSLNVALPEVGFTFLLHIYISWPSKSNPQSTQVCGFHSLVAIRNPGGNPQSGGGVPREDAPRGIPPLDSILTPLPK